MTLSDPPATLSYIKPDTYQRKRIPMRLRTITDLLTESNVSARSSLTDDGRSQTVLYRGGGNGGPSLTITEQARGNLYDLARYDGYSDEPFVVTGVTPLAAVMAAVDFHRTN